jgi:N-acetylglucosaminyldiphosphoundecaprenol N-acetyl-beta-D-mannosaminyltransferase
MTTLTEPMPDVAMRQDGFDRFAVLGVSIHNVTRREVVDAFDAAIRDRDDHAKSVFIVNAHTLNLAAADPSYRKVLNSGDYVLADGTGVRWAARMQGIQVRENLVGTDPVPEMFRKLAGRQYSYFLLGADPGTIAVASEYARREFPGWNQAGCHHGFLTDDLSDYGDLRSLATNAPVRTTSSTVIQRINAVRPDVLLVGMGNPIQERWIHDHLGPLRVPLCIGVGGLFDYWAGNVRRAPQWLRRAGHEWLWRLYQQPILKARRYLVGNPLFLARVLRDRFTSSRSS